MVEDNVDFLVEWAVWAHLDSKTDSELILLKGHLLLESILGIVLKRNSINQIDNFSFHRRINEFEKINFKEASNKHIIVQLLRNLNKLRNKLAHELFYKTDDGKLELWSKNVLDNFKGQKFTKFTTRTKIVHAFSILSMNIIELK